MKRYRNFFCALVATGATLCVCHGAAAVVIAPWVDSFSSQNPLNINRFAVHTVNGTGLSGIGEAGDTHINAINGVSWTTVGNLGPTPLTDYDPQITYDLGGLINVDTLRIWNDNNPGSSQLGTKDIEVFAGATLGTMTSRGTISLAQGTELATYTGEDFAVNYTGVRFVQFDIKSNHDGALLNGEGPGNGGTDGRFLTGLAEVRIEGAIAGETLVAPFVHAFSSELTALGRQAANSVNGSGLTGIGNLGDAHDVVEGNQFWTTAGNLGGGFGTDFDPEITFDLGGVVNVTKIREWGYNNSAITFIGPDLVEIFTSTDGSTFISQGTVNFAQASGLNTYGGNDIAVDLQGIRYIKLDILTNHDGAVFDGTGVLGGTLDPRSLTGLSEIRFVVNSVTIPTPAALPAGLALLGLAMGRRRRVRR
ncbi:MAG: hypothetical protein H8E63_06830 [Proteobacteria bacterium]|nr:hypothetical protein [Pseudomonadota bacterium]